MQDIDYSKLLSGMLTNIFIDAYKGVGNWASVQDDKNDYFGRRAKTYGEKLFKRYNYIRVFGMNEPVPLTDLYVRVNILEEITETWRVNPEELAKRFARDHRAFSGVRETKTGIEAINSVQKFVLLGKPGAGKTTYLKYLALQSVHKDSNIAVRKLPIFITLHKLAKKFGGDLLACIEEEFDTCNLEDARQFIEALLKNGKCLILLDGLDEVPQAQKEEVIDAINDFSDKYDDNQYVLSCRIHAYNAAFPHFKDLELADFNNEQKQHFIQRWFKTEPELGEELWESLKNQEQLLELAATPVLLTLMCIDYDENYDLQANRASIYKSAIETLLTKWDSSRRIRRGEIYKNLTTDRKMQLFSILAAKTFEADQIFIEEAILVKHIGDFLRTLTDVKLDNLESDSKAVLKAIVAQHGILTPRAKGIYSFLHLTFQEYFTAKYILDNAATGTIEHLIHSHAIDDNWKEVFLLVTNMTLNAEFLFVRFKAFIDDDFYTHTKLLKIVKKTLKGESIHSILQRKCFALSYILDFSLEQYDDARDDYLYDFTHDRIRDFLFFIIQKITKESIHDELINGFYIDYDYEFNEEYGININLIHRNSPVIKYELLVVLEEYIKKNIRFFQCLNQPISITPALKEKLLNEILDISEGLEEYGNTAASGGGLFASPNPISRETKENLKTLLARDQRNEVFEQIAPLIDKYTAKENKLLLLQNRQYKLEAEQHKGTISAENAKLESNQILEALLQFINTL